MNYLEAKSVLLERPPRVTLKLIAIEVAALLGAAAILLQLFG